MRLVLSIASLAGLLAAPLVRGDALTGAALNALSEARSVLAREAQMKYPAVSQWSIEPIRPSLPQALDVLPAESELVVTKFGARSAVRVSWAPAGEVRQLRTLWFEVIGMQPVVVATRDLKGGETLSQSDALLEERDVLGANCSIVRSVAAVERMRVKRPLRAGAVVCADALEPRPPVARGDECIVHYRSARVSLDTKGVAQQDGQIGAKLRVTNLESKESFFAVVSAAREVVVYE